MPKSKSKDPIGRIAADTRSGANQIAIAACRELLKLEPGSERLRAVRRLLRAHAASGSMWQIAQACDDDDALAGLRDSLRTAPEAVGRAARWLKLPRGPVVVTISSSKTVDEALAALAPSEVRFLLSTPEGEGKRAAARARRAGLTARVVPDTHAGRALQDADLVVMGADCIGPVVVNKIGSRALALLAADSKVPAYAFADRTKLVHPDVARRAVPPYEAFPASLLAGVITEDGPLRTATLRALEARSVPRDVWRAAGFRGDPQGA